MRVGMLGRKVGMTQIYETDGTAVPITVLECGPCTVLQVRTADRDGYHAVQLGFADKKRKNASQAERGHAKKANAEPKRLRPRDPPDRADRRGRGPDADGRRLRRDRPGRRHRHQQGPGLHGRHEAARLQGPAGDARRQADAPPPGLVGPERRPGRTPARASASPASSATRGSPSRISRSSGSTRTNNLLLVRGAVPGPTAATSWSARRTRSEQSSMSTAGGREYGRDRPALTSAIRTYRVLDDPITGCQPHAERPRIQRRRREGGRGIDRPGRLRRRGQQAAAARRRA